MVEAEAEEVEAEEEAEEEAAAVERLQHGAGWKRPFGGWNSEVAPSLSLSLVSPPLCMYVCLSVCLSLAAWGGSTCSMGWVLLRLEF